MSRFFVGLRMTNLELGGLGIHVEPGAYQDYGAKNISGERAFTWIYF